MKIKLLKSLNIYLFILILFSVSCSKDTDTDKTPLPVLHKGTLSGSVKLFDKSGNENFKYDDLKITVIDSLNTLSEIYPDPSGTFKIDNVPYGNLFLIIDKPGYGLVDTLGYNLQKTSDTLSTIIMAEELPLRYNTFSISYSNKMIYYYRSTEYKTTDSYLVGELICFGKNADVSLNNCAYFMGTGSYSNVSMINWTTSSGTSCSLQSFTNNGIQTGDRVYAVCYPIIHASFTFYNEQNFKILSYKISNPSPVSTFVLKE